MVSVQFKKDVTACTSISFVETIHLLNGESMSQLIPGSGESLKVRTNET